MTDPESTPPSGWGGPPPGPPAGGQGWPPPPQAFGSPPPPGSPDGWGPPGPAAPGQWPQFTQPAAQPFHGGNYGPGWVPELGVQIGSAGARIGGKALDIFFFIVIQTALSLVGAAAFFASSTELTDELIGGGNTLLPSGTDIVTTVALSALLLGVDFLYNVVPTATVGGTPGKLIAGLRVIRTDGAKVDFRTAFIRWSPILALGLLGALPIVGILAGLLRFVLLIVNLVMVLSDERRQSVFDRVGGTYVIRSR
jgi:uncharacterized RDD family membrane protein YckC